MHTKFVAVCPGALAKVLWLCGGACVCACLGACERWEGQQGLQQHTISGGREGAEDADATLRKARHGFHYRYVSLLPSFVFAFLLLLVLTVRLLDLFCHNIHTKNPHMPTS